MLALSVDFIYVICFLFTNVHTQSPNNHTHISLRPWIRHRPSHSVSSFHRDFQFYLVLTLESVLTFESVLTLLAAVRVQTRHWRLRRSIKHAWCRPVPRYIRFHSRWWFAFGQCLSHPPLLAGANEGSDHSHDGVVASRCGWERRLKSDCNLWSVAIDIKIRVMTLSGYRKQRRFLSHATELKDAYARSEWRIYFLLNKVSKRVRCITMYSKSKLNNL